MRGKNDEELGPRAWAIVKLTDSAPRLACKCCTCCSAVENPTLARHGATVALHANAQLSSHIASLGKRHPRPCSIANDNVVMKAQIEELRTFPQLSGESQVFSGRRRIA